MLYDLHVSYTVCLRAIFILIWEIFLLNYCKNYLLLGHIVLGNQEVPLHFYFYWNFNFKIIEVYFCSPFNSI